MWPCCPPWGRLIPFPVIYKLWKALCAKDKNKNTGLYFYTNYAPDYFYVEMKKEWDDTVEEISFEDTSSLSPQAGSTSLPRYTGII